MAKEIGSLNVVVGLDATGFQNGIGSLNREMKKVQSEFKLASTELGKHGKELDGLKLKSMEGTFLLVKTYTLQLSFHLSLIM